MDKVLFITPGPIEWASSRMRAHWIAEGIEGAEVSQVEASLLSEKRHAIV